MDRTLSPLQRVEKMWRSVFLVRIWRYYVLKAPTLTLKDNFMSHYSYYCIEQNAHSLVLILTFLQRNNLTHLFLPHLLCSQPCESFYRQVRSLTSTNSTVVNFSTKEILNRISRIQILSEISNDKDSGFIFPKPLHSSKDKYVYFDIPNENEIIHTILKSKNFAIQEAITIGLIKKNAKTDSMCVCHVPKYIPVQKKVERESDSDGSDYENIILKTDELHVKLLSASLINYAEKFQNKMLQHST